MQVLQDKAALIELLQANESWEVFWFPFNSLFDSHIKKVGDKRATLTGLNSEDLVHGKMQTAIAWDPWMDDLYMVQGNKFY